MTQLHSRPFRFLFVAGILSVAARTQGVHHRFEQDVPGAAPQGFHAAETGGAGHPATWRVAGAETQDGKQVVAVQTTNGGETFNLLLSDVEHAADLTIAVWLRACSGREDQGGGVVWRAKDANNYYVARWNPLEENVRLYKVERGKRTLFASSDVVAAIDAWHRLSVTMRGPDVTVRLEGQERLRWRDTTFADGGRVGLWTKADASTEFDRLDVQAPPPLLTSPFVSEPPLVDGSADDAAWRRSTAQLVPARRAMPPGAAPEIEVQLRCVHTETDVFVLVRWQDDDDDDVMHKPWTWNAANGAYEEGPEREDMLALGFAHTGEFEPDMLACPDSVWDVWHWKAVRTNPAGYAMDRTHRYASAPLPGKAREYRARNGTSIWIARPEDQGDSVERKRAAPATRGADVVPQYAAGTPSGSAADVRAKGRWQDGWWTLELARRLDTGHPDDTVFVRGGRTLIAVSTHDRTGDMDRATAAVELELEGASK